MIPYIPWVLLAGAIIMLLSIGYIYVLNWNEQWQTVLISGFVGAIVTLLGILSQLKESTDPGSVPIRYLLDFNSNSAYVYGSFNYRLQITKYGNKPQALDQWVVPYGA